MRPGETELLALAQKFDQTYAIVAVVKRTYSFESTGSSKLTIADEPSFIRHLPELDLHTREYLDDTDVLPPKLATDVVVMGTAHARAPVRELTVAVAVGNLARQLRVVGERRADVGRDGAISFTSSEPFEMLELSDRVAYGGYDEEAQDALDPLSAELVTQFGGKKPPMLYSYARNQIGRAWFVDHDRRRADGALLPRIEDPSDLLTPERFFAPSAAAWIDAPMPGRLGWMHPARYPRLGRIAGGLLEHAPPARPLRESLFPDGSDLTEMLEQRPPRPNPRVFQGAAPGLAGERLRGDELCILRNLHREAAELRFNLPGETPKVTLRFPDLKSMSPAAVLNTVRFEPDFNRVSLTWVAAIPSAGPVPSAMLATIPLGVSWSRLG